MRPVLGLLIFLLGAHAAAAEALRVALFNTDLSRAGPGLLLRDIEAGKDPQVAAVRAVIDRADADVLVLQGIDWDYALAALRALNEDLAAPYPHLFALVPNSGLMTDLDLDGDGRRGGPGDAQGYGEFLGTGGMAVLSRRAFGTATDFSALLWRDLPGARMPVRPDGSPFPSAEAQPSQRLSSSGHWVLPVEVAPDRVLTLLVFAATPPVFDGPEDMNGLRNADELRLWQAFLGGALDVPPPGSRIVLAGDANLDPLDGDGLKDTLPAFLDATPLTDPRPRSPGGMAAAAQGGANAGQRGDPALDTADWPEDPGPGNLRVDYLLPSEDLTVTGAGVLWPAPDDPFAATVEAASRHRLLWLDLDL